MARRAEVDGSALVHSLSGKTSERCSGKKRCELLTIALDMERSSSRSGIQSMIMPEGAVALRGTKSGAPLFFFTYCPFCGNQIDGEKVAR